MHQIPNVSLPYIYTHEHCLVFHLESATLAAIFTTLVRRGPLNAREKWDHRVSLESFTFSPSHGRIARARTLVTLSVLYIGELPIVGGRSPSGFFLAAKVEGIRDDCRFCYIGRGGSR